MRFLGLVPPLAVIAAIHYLSSLEPAKLPLQAPIPYFDKWAHLGVYALLLSSFRLWRGRTASPARWLPGAIAASLVVAVGDEWHQSLVPGRMPELLDIVADATGISAAAALWAGWSVYSAHRTLR